MEGFRKHEEQNKQTHTTVNLIKQSYRNTNCKYHLKDAPGNMHFCFAKLLSAPSLLIVEKAKVEA